MNTPFTQLLESEFPNRLFLEIWEGAEVDYVPLRDTAWTAFLEDTKTRGKLATPIVLDSDIQIIDGLDGYRAILHLGLCVGDNIVFHSELDTDSKRRSFLKKAKHRRL